MLIDNAYIHKRLDDLIKEKQNSAQAEKENADKLYRIKMRFPKWLRIMVFHPFNPAYSVYLQRKASRNKSKNDFMALGALHPLAVDFVKYCFQKDINFNPSSFYPKEDESEIVQFIDNRLKSVIPGYNYLKTNEQHKDILKKKKVIEDATRKVENGYSLALDGYDYFLPSNSFQEHTYIHEYGLKYLPAYVHGFIAGKDFLDIGAYLGDTSIMLLKKYKPEKVYAYEPVTANAEHLKETIRMNNTDRIIVVNRGMGDKEEDIDIYINPDQLSSCSTNDALAATSSIKEKIHITTIDKECKDRKVGLIKMDIEGAEYSAIQGGKETIKRDKPVLLISLYHTGKDFFEIPAVLKEWVPDYNFRFMNIEIQNPISEKILVAYPKQTK
ncbi:FkbM family methyltransferase [Prevotella sp. 10(H)]|uniref:FkbM family methyltransferase n=1 Tax=Prevotella sp. 10(H) TaxID=1158294 RepID=UPI0004A748D7|nr:FkbM family methyltransferase [Prevotella sp. 10(H)]